MAWPRVGDAVPVWWCDAGPRRRIARPWGAASRAFGGRGMNQTTSSSLPAKTPGRQSHSSWPTRVPAAPAHWSAGDHAKCAASPAACPGLATRADRFADTSMAFPERWWQWSAADRQALAVNAMDAHWQPSSVGCGSSGPYGMTGSGWSEHHW